MAASRTSSPVTTFTHPVVGVDGREGGQDAIALAGLLAAPAAELELAHVWLMLEGLGAAALGARPGEDAERLLREAEQHAGVAGRRRPRYDSSVAAGLHHLCEESHADLLVVGSCHRQGAGRVLLGDDARAAVHTAPCAVAVAPRGFAAADRAIRRVGVGWRGTDEDAEALAIARRLAAEHEAELHVLTVVGPAPGPVVAQPYAYAEVVMDLEGQRVREAQERQDRLEGVAGRVVVGRSDDELRRLSEGVDLLVLGSRGYGPVRRLLLGSTADALLGDAHCPVLVVPRAGRADAGTDAVHRAAATA